MEHTKKNSKKTSFPAPRSSLPVIQFQDGDYGKSIIAFPSIIIPIPVVLDSILEKRISQAGRVIFGHTHEFKIIETENGREAMPDPYRYATLGTIRRITHAKESAKVDIELTARIRMDVINLEEICICDRWEVIGEEYPTPFEFHTESFQRHIRVIKDVVSNVGAINIAGEIFIPPNLQETDLNEKNVGAFIDQSAFLFNHFGALDRVAKFLRSILAEPNVSRRMDLFASLLDDIRHQQKFFKDFFSKQKEEDGENEEISTPGNKTKKDIRGTDGEKNGEYEKYNRPYQKIKEKLSQEVRDAIEHELEQLQSEKQAIESKNHLEFLLKLFSLEETEDRTDIPAAKAVLNEDHAGLEKPKERVLEHLAVREYASGGVSILCFVGPTGVGKTSLGASIARALGRKFVRLSLGGFRDEAEIRGHGYTYTRTQPGWLIKKIIESGSKNPVFVLDEIDKVGRDWRGDPASVLLEALDPEQNKAFLDLSIALPYDFSKVFFICTANTTSTIPTALKDRLEIIRISGYTPYEKLAIAKNHLIAKILKQNGFPLPRMGASPITITLSDGAIVHLIEKYTNESGVRQLERAIRGITRKVVLRFRQGEIPTANEINITEDNLQMYAGKPLIYPEQRFDNLPPGCVPMFAVSDTGGYFFYVEVMFERGHEQRKIKVTGVRGSEIPHNVNNVIEESVDVAFDSLMFEGGILHQTEQTREKEKEFHVHVHISDNAVPKDGPSAGIPILAGLYGRMRNKSIQPNLGATGEIDMVMGAIHSVGGIREKSLAAYRAGIKRFIIPEDNIRDLDEIPEEIKKEIEFLPKRSAWDALLAMFPDDELLMSYIESRRSS